MFKKNNDMLIIQNIKILLKRFRGFLFSPLLKLQERALLLEAYRTSCLNRARAKIDSISEVEFSVFSQWGEDGILDWLIYQCPEIPNTFVEFGVENYLEALEEHQPDILGMSALLTTTMPYMKVVVDAMVEKGVRDDYIVMVGGAPLNEAFGESVGADAYCRDAAVAVETAKALIAKRREVGAA